MKISARWIQQLFPFDVSVERAAEVLTATGLEVEGVEHVEDVPGGLEGVLVGQITSVKPHPNADRLQLCKVDLGNEVVDIVCGASNVAEGQKVPVATVGCTLHPTYGEAFKIKKGKIRGEISLGMICAEDELGLGSSHEGILILDDHAQVGQPLAEFIGMGGDDVIEIGLTPNRNDAMGHWGVARDLRSGLMHGTVSGVGPMDVNPLAFPETTPLKEALSRGCSIQLNVEAKEDCPHYLAVELTHVTVAPSPAWAQKQLRAIGVQPINNVVDATNMVLHELGNPLHAFDLDKIQGAQVHVRKAIADEHLVTLDDQTRKLDSTDLVIADSKGAMCLAGVYGGAHSGVNETTNSILLEAAWFHPVTVRKTAKRHTLSTDASFRFERGVDPASVRLAAERCVRLLQDWSGAQLEGAVEFKGEPRVKDTIVKIELSWLFGFLGITIDQKRLNSILSSLDIEVVNQENDCWTLQVPAYRSDVTRPADIAEEVLRIHGFDHVPLPTRMTGTLEIPFKPNREDVLFGWRELLVNLGFTEIMSNSLTKASYAEIVEDRDLVPSASVNMLNPLSSDLAAMRQSLIFQGLEAIARNINHKQLDLRMFEFGRTYTRRFDEDGNSNYIEKEHLSLWVTGRSFPESWNKPKGKEGQADLFTLKHAVEMLLERVGLIVVSDVEPTQEGLLAEGILMRHRNGNEIGRWGLVQPSVADACGVNQPVFWADFDVSQLWKAMKKRNVKAQDLPKYPSVRRDLALVVDRSMTYETLRQAAMNAEKKLLKDISLFDVYQGKGLEDHEKSYAMAFTLQAPNATLHDKQIESAMTRILEAIQSVGGRLR